MIRNIISLFRHHFWPMLLNIAGLALAFCAFILITVQVGYEKGFDKSYPGYEKIFRVDRPDDNTLFKSILPPGFAMAVINSSPHIECGTVFCPFVGEVYFTFENAMGEVQGFKQEVNVVNPEIFDVFGMEIVEGDRNALEIPASVAIPESIARKLFGKESAIGKVIRQERGSGMFDDNDEWTVRAVYRDLPSNSQIRNNFYLRLPDYFHDLFGGSNFSCWLRLDDPANASAVASAFNSTFDFEKHPYLSEIELVPVEDIYYMEGKSDQRVYRGGNLAQTRILIAVSVLVILIGLFNYTNFYTALVPVRLKEINTRKVLGASVWRLRLSMMGETMVLSLIACLIAVLLSVWVSSVLYTAGILSIPFSLGGDWSIVLLAVGVAVVSGLLAGLYPGFYATSFQPALVLKGAGTITPSGRKLKTALMGLQYVISITLLIFVTFIFLQNRLMGKGDSGFDKESLAVVELTNEMVASDGKWFADELKRSAGVEDVAFSMEVMGGQDDYNTSGAEWRGKQFQYFVVYCSENFPALLGLDMVEGRGFLPAESGSGSSSSGDGTTEVKDGDSGQSGSSRKRAEVIFTENAKTAYGLELGIFSSSFAESMDIVGFSSDVQFSSFRKEQIPICFMPIPPEYGYTGVAYIRFAPGTDVYSLSDKITGAVREMDPTYPCEVKFYDMILNRLYAKEQRFGTLIELMSVLAIILSLTGVLGMAIFDVYYKRREIAVRRVMGAEHSDIVMNGNRYYLLLCLVSFAIAVPVSWMVTMRWLEGFSLRTGMHPWVFVLALAVVAALTAAVVSLLFSRAARANPVEGLHAE